MFDRFINRVVITGELLVMTGLHIGSGDRSMMPNSSRMPLIRDSLGDPFIPGSSLKGVLRSFSERLMGGECICGEKCQAHYKNLEDRRKAGDTFELARKINADACVNCRLFGSQVLRGKLFIRDALLVNREDFRSQSGIELRFGNAINRDTHTVDGGFFYDYEVVPAGTRFAFHAIAENITEKDEVGTLTGLLTLLERGELILGGKRARGLGTITLEEIKVHRITAREGLAGLFENAKDTYGTLEDIRCLLEDTEEVDAHV